MYWKVKKLMPRGKAMRSTESSRKCDRPSEVTRALKLSTPKLKYLKKAKRARLVTIEVHSATFCTRVLGPPGSSSGSGPRHGRRRPPVSARQIGRASCREG